MTTIETNKAAVRAYVAAMNRGDMAALARLFTPDAAIAGVTGSGGLEFAVPIWTALHQALNMHLTIDALVAEGDTVSARYTERGRWTAPFLGFANPTGRSYELLAIEWFEMKAGLIHRRWGARDGASQARQVGFPAPAQARCAPGTTAAA
ncbi:ester cyclase [Rhodobacteraceae bacterium 2CG4]|uniref:Ester cyclase n=1 Tax=Halovulum marinum TaxID=2662447 RepID=A0A6L5Z0M1_9RHOB|nr:ester cyclase [Halovulum marinum]MSU90087.1 ester cyclase [Halovulum marinum]